MDKSKLITVIEEHLREELAQVQGRDAGREQELLRLIDVYRFLPRREYGAEDVAIPSALAELEVEPGGTRAFYLLAPQGGGLVTQVDGKAVQVITPQSPLGEALLGKKVGARFSVDTRGGKRQYRVVSLR